MILKSLEIINFRNYRREKIEPASAVNFITGMNAQGKTNILEAIYLGCTGRSFRTLKEKELIKWSSEHAQITCLFETYTRSIEVRILINPGQKHIEVNGSSIKGYPLGWPGMVLFTPDDLTMVKGSPGERRRFLDFEIGPFHPRYSHYLSRYNRVLAQRNNLLKDIREKRAERDSLQAWDEQFCLYGSKILSIRLELLKKLIPDIRSLHRQLTGEMEEIDIRYLSSLNISGIKNEEDIYLRFKSELEGLAKEEIEKVHTLIGPHRDDFSILLNGSEARVYGSQGQQRTIVLTLKLSQILQWHNEISEYPILLLDDVLFELDSSRREALLQRIHGQVQTFVTTTGVEKFDFKIINRSKFYKVSEGNIYNGSEKGE